MDRWKTGLQIWKNYANVHCLENDKNKELMYWVLLSQLLKCNFVENGLNKSIREHLFLVQSSRTGKGKLLQATHYMFEWFNKQYKKRSYTVAYISGELTPQTLAGGYEDRINPTGKKTRIYVKGLLETHDFIAWGEASDLIDAQQRWGSLRGRILNALDDGIPVTLTARKDLHPDGTMPQYYTNTSFAAVTAPMSKMNTDFKAQGLLQRFLFGYDIIRGERRDNLDDNLALLPLQSESQTSDNRSLHWKGKFFDFFPHTRDSPNAYTTKLVFQDNNSLVDYTRYKKELLKKYKEFDSGQQGDAIRGMITASYVHDKKIATMMASINGQTEITYDNLKSAADMTEYCVKSFVDFVLQEYSHTESDGFIKRQQIITKILKRQGALIQANLLDELMNLKVRGTWDMGHNKTYEFIQELIDKNIILTKKGDRNKVILYV